MIGQKYFILVFDLSAATYSLKEFPFIRSFIQEKSVELLAHARH